jgi:hypothetical protein
MARDTDVVTRALREGDPLSREAGLSAEDAAAMRRAIVAAVDRQPSRAAAWPRPLMFAATLAATIVAGVLVRTRFPSPRPAAVRSQVATPPAGGAAAPDVERRQLQFSTPGGTRIIWVFDPEFNP